MPSLFLSTLSLRRATRRSAAILASTRISIHALLAESDAAGDRAAFKVYISIHALLAESDAKAWICTRSASRFLSTLSLRRATLHQHVERNNPAISIHALLAESDTCNIVLPNILLISIHALLAESDMVLPLICNANSDFYPRSPCGERPSLRVSISGSPSFLSTLSLRRATLPVDKMTTTATTFLSTLSLRRATLPPHEQKRGNRFLSTLSLRRATR